MYCCVPLRTAAYRNVPLGTRCVRLRTAVYHHVPVAYHCVTLRTVAISVTVRVRVKWTKFCDHKGYKIQITNIRNFIEKNQNGRLYQKCYLSNIER